MLVYELIAITSSRDTSYPNPVLCKKLIGKMNII